MRRRVLAELHGVGARVDRRAHRARGSRHEGHPSASRRLRRAKVAGLPKPQPPLAQPHAGFGHGAWLARRHRRRWRRERSRSAVNCARFAVRCWRDVFVWQSDEWGVATTGAPACLLSRLPQKGITLETTCVTAVHHLECYNLLQNGCYVQPVAAAESERHGARLKPSTVRASRRRRGPHPDRDGSIAASRLAAASYTPASPALHCALSE